MLNIQQKMIIGTTYIKFTWEAEIQENTKKSCPILKT